MCSFISNTGSVDILGKVCSVIIFITQWMNFRCRAFVGLRMGPVYALRNKIVWASDRQN